MAPVLNLLAQSYGIGPRTPEHPQLAASAAGQPDGVGGERACSAATCPGTMIMRSAPSSASAVIILDQILKARGSQFRVPVLAAAIGIYLPLETMVPIFLGGLLNHLVTRTFGKDLSEDEVEKRNRIGTLFAAGLITGEALIGIFIGFAIYGTKSADVFCAAGGHAARRLARRMGRALVVLRCRAATGCIGAGQARPGIDGAGEKWG